MAGYPYTWAWLVRTTGSEETPGLQKSPHRRERTWGQARRLLHSLFFRRERRLLANIHHAAGIAGAHHHAAPPHPHPPPPPPPRRTRTLPAMRRPPSRQYTHGLTGTRSRSRTGRNDGRN